MRLTRLRDKKFVCPYCLHTSNTLLFSVNTDYKSLHWVKFSCSYCGIVIGETTYSTDGYTLPSKKQVFINSLSVVPSPATITNEATASTGYLFVNFWGIADGCKVIYINKEVNGEFDEIEENLENPVRFVGAAEYFRGFLKLSFFTELGSDRNVTDSKIIWLQNIRVVHTELIQLNKEKAQEKLLSAIFNFLRTQELPEVFCEN